MPSRVPAAVLAFAVLAGAAADGVAQDNGRKVGELLPDLRLPTIDREKTVRLSEFRGSKVLLIEFASW